MEKESKDIHQVIKDKFGINKLSDEKFSKSKYWDSAVSKDDSPSESRRANPDTLSDVNAPWSNSDGDEKALRLESLKEIGEVLKGREREVYLLLLRYPYSEVELASKLQVSQQRISAILQRIRLKVYKKYGSKRSELDI